MWACKGVDTEVIAACFCSKSAVVIYSTVLYYVSLSNCVLYTMHGYVAFGGPREGTA